MSLDHLDAALMATDAEQQSITAFHRACVVHNGLINATTAARIIGVSRQRMEKLHGSEWFQPYEFFGARWFAVDEVMDYKTREDRKPGRPILTLARRFSRWNGCQMATNNRAKGGGL